MPLSTNSDTVTEGIRVQVFPDYIPEQSNPELNRFTFSYRVIITNQSETKVKLLSRHWLIINSEGDQESVNGPGVVGYTPELGPRESFEYTSFCPINTGWGTMEGSYTMIKENSEKFEAEIGRFYLVSDEVLAE
ncbi:MAG: Co2+/Mg2+ efflux protein ApaG [Chlorobi bacterium]|nr:Co2+/Mg2+ efflux protein ApaG [Chlorobiota bacterium]MCI0716384.1 Co2+/Mg2+ efflux protein ApaG [Chlorobiota bacterium]